MTTEPPLEPLSHERLTQALTGLDAGPFRANLHVYPRLGSTNDLARELAEQGAPEGTLVIADEQTAGRGRAGRAWLAPPRTALLMSIIFRPILPADQTYRLVMACGLAVATASEALAAVSVSVKWPNDLQIEGLKFTGILPESAITGQHLDWLVIGVGVNVNQVFAPDHPLARTATSLRMASGRIIHRPYLLARILADLYSWHQHLSDDSLITAWRSRCVTLGQYVRAETPHGPLMGHAEDIDSSGALWLRDRQGQLHRLVMGEVTSIRPPE